MGNGRTSRVSSSRGGSRTSVVYCPGWKFFEERKNGRQVHTNFNATRHPEEETARQATTRAVGGTHYLGQTHEELEQYAEAVEAYQRCFEIRDRLGRNKRLGVPSTWRSGHSRDSVSSSRAVESVRERLAYANPASPNSLGKRRIALFYENGRRRDANFSGQRSRAGLGHYEGLEKLAKEGSVFAT